MKVRLGRPSLVFVALLCSANMWFYWNRLPHITYALRPNADKLRAKALSDLYSRWYGALRTSPPPS